jgi:hypothetical protein
LIYWFAELQLTPSKVPVAGVPSPITRLNKPYALVVTLCVSEYSTGPAADPERIEIRTLIGVFT